MRRVPLVVLAFLLAAPAAARADGLETLQDLAKRHLRPAPLVPTSAPRPLSELSAALDTAPGRGKRGYGLRLVHYGSYGPDAIIALERGAYRSTRSALRDHRRNGYRVRRTRLRGRRAFLLTRKLGGVRSSALLWREDGSVYLLDSGTPKKVSVRGMRATAAGLDHLGANYGGSFFAEGSNNTSLGATLVTTRHFISGVIEWGTDNCTSNGFPAAARGGSASFLMLPLRRGAFSMPLAEGWNGSLSGTVSAPAVSVALQGSGSFDGVACDTGPMTVTADRGDPL
jgi:hypothetical protein